VKKAPADKSFEGLLQYLRRTHGFDFTGYKRAGLERRVERRMQTVGLRKFDEYQAYLESHAEEFVALFNTILINVTAFFRDEAAWEYLAKEAIPALLAHRKGDSPIRIWSAGCAGGQEAYTLAMILSEALGAEAFRQRVKIYATDVDEEALLQARQASYTEKEIEGVSKDLRKKYFELVGGRYVFRAEPRRSIIFGRHDLVQDAPMSRLDLLVCRNALMYFNAEAQSRILARFHFALREFGLLFLGKAEMLVTRSTLFEPLELKHRIFRKVPSADIRAQAATLAGTPPPVAASVVDRMIALREAAFETAPIARLAVDLEGRLALANATARTLFGLRPQDLGRPLQDLEVSYRPVELRSVIEKTYADRRPVRLPEVERRVSAGELQYLDVEVAPLNDATGAILGAAVTVRDVTQQHLLKEEILRSKQELETTNEELQSTNEELETTNEELQSTNEELETTNEELQSTNEEMETMNEELQSSNAELQTLNDELRQRTDDLNNTNSLTESVLSSLRAGVVAIDRNLLIQAWNTRATDFWGLRAEEALGHSFMTLDIGLPVGDLKKPLQLVLAGKTNFQELTLPATNRRGKKITCRITCTPRLGAGGERQGVILQMEEGDAL
jgi:two-component system, chemotaxis family, CheB/CheR fusion protein